MQLQARQIGTVLVPAEALEHFGGAAAFLVEPADPLQRHVEVGRPVGIRAGREDQAPAQPASELVEHVRQRTLAQVGASDAQGLQGAGERAAVGL